MFLAGRVIVFSKRPARVIAEIDVRSRLGENRTLEMRDGVEFFALRNEVLGLARASAGEER
jgi:hypothetical protein